MQAYADLVIGDQLLVLNRTGPFPLLLTFSPSVSPSVRPKAVDISTMAVSSLLPRPPSLPMMVGFLGLLSKPVHPAKIERCNGPSFSLDRKGTW